MVHYNIMNGISRCSGPRFRAIQYTSLCLQWYIVPFTQYLTHQHSAVLNIWSVDRDLNIGLVGTIHYAAFSVDCNGS